MPILGVLAAKLGCGGSICSLDALRRSRPRSGAGRPTSCDSRLNPSFIGIGEESARVLGGWAGYRSPMATLYRCPTPTNWLCPCGKVARALKADGVEYQEVRVPQRRSKREEVHELTGQQRVPVLVLGRDAICDSRRIVEHLAWRREQTATPTEPAAGAGP